MNYRRNHEGSALYYYEQRIRGYFYNDMRYINLRFTYLLTYLRAEFVSPTSIQAEHD